MKKITKIVCGIFILSFFIENISFVYAQNEDTQEQPANEIILNQDNDNQSDLKSGDNEIDEINEPNDNDDNFVNNNEEEPTSEEINNQTEVENEPTPKLRGAPMLMTTQATQYIDTSDYGIIRIKDPNNTGKGITILDRNLGATATGAGVDESKKSFGYYFQWGNNYGFPSDPNAEISTTGTKVDASEYGPNTDNGYYSSNIFIKGSNDWSSVHNDNLRGGSGDSKNGNGRGYPVTNPEDRRGPCPENYHVPSIGEWSKLLEFWKSEYEEVSLYLENGLYNFSSDLDSSNAFHQRFNIPLAGQINYNSSVDRQNLESYYFSSSTHSSNYAYRLYGKMDSIFISYRDYRSYAFPIRCFYNSYRLPVKITYDVNGGYWTENESTENKIIIYTKSDDISDFSGDTILGAAKRDNNCGENEDKKCMFGGWYTLTGDKLRTGNISEDITLYAKWLEFDDKDILYSGINFSIMDRNLGAEISGTGEDAYGYYLTGEDDIVCPEGYHIPNTGEWLGIKELLDSDLNGDYVNNLFNLPFAGKSLNNEIIEAGVNAYYLAKDWNEVRYAKISNSDIEIGDLDGGEKVSVRCFKDYNTGTIKFYSNGGNEISDIVAVNRREEGEDLQVPERDNSIFSGWYTTSDFQEGTEIGKNINYKNDEEINLYAKRECEEGYQANGNACEAIYFNITWIDGDGNILNTDSVRWGGMPIYTGATPTKSSTADYKYTFNGNWLPEIIPVYEDTGYIAQFDAEVIKRSGGSSGGGGGKKDAVVSNDIEKSTEYQTGNSSVDFTPSVTTGQIPLKKEYNNETQIIPPSQKEMSEEQGELLKDFPQEFIDAYNFAYKNGITTKSSIYDAKMYSPLTRIQMAKMLSNYAINVLGKEPDISKGMIKFSDVSDKLNKEYDNTVTLAYQLGIMGQNIKNGKFRPYDEVTRAEFATALSRLLYGIEDGKGKIKYYEPHITKLYNEGAINKTNSTLREKRGYVMIILERYKKNFIFY